MDRIKLDYSKVLSFVGEEEIAVQREKATKALKDLEDGTCKGSDFLGWLDLPVHITDDELDRISACANKLREQTDVVVIVGNCGLLRLQPAVAVSNSWPSAQPATIWRASGSR